MCYPEIVALSHVIIRPGHVETADLLDNLHQLYDEVARQLNLPAFAPDNAYDPFIGWIHGLRRNRERAAALRKAQYG